MAIQQQVRLQRRVSLIAQGALISATVAYAPMLWAQELSMGADELMDLPLEALMQMDTTVVSASKRDETLKDAPAAIYVIGKEDLRRAAITNIPDALRMVPGVQVARVSASEWAISARGLGGRYARYLLVLIDGRSIYTSLFSGVNWDEQNLSLEDIERIEVVRGPGGSVWGANAVNGVVNIITRKPDKQGGIKLRATVGGGEEKGSLYGRADFSTGENSEAFASIHTQRNGALSSITPNLEGDDWQSSRLSLAWQLSEGSNTLNVSGGVFGVESTVPWAKQLLQPPWVEPLYSLEEKNGLYGSLKWQRKTDKGQWYLLLNSDDTERKTDAFDWETRNYDMEWQWTGDFGQKQMITAGVFARYTDSDFSVPADGSGVDVVLEPENQSSKTYSVYFQDTIALSSTLSASLGARLDDHSLSGLGVQPSARLMWRVNSEQRIWGAVSKANSTPSRVLNSQSEISFSTLPPNPSAPPPASYLPTRLSLSSQGDNEADVNLVAFELGYRYSPSDSLSVDGVVFEHHYDNILGIKGPGEPELRMSPAGQGYIHIPIYSEASNPRKNQGAELVVAYKPWEVWFVQYSGTFLNVEQGFGESVDNIGFNLAETVPKWQHVIRSLWRVNHVWDLDFSVRYVGALENTAIPSYVSADVKMGYQINHQLSLSVNARNLLNDKNQHIETEREILNIGTFVVEPYVYLKVEWGLGE